MKKRLSKIIALLLVAAMLLIIFKYFNNYRIYANLKDDVELYNLQEFYLLDNYFVSDHEIDELEVLINSRYEQELQIESTTNLIINELGYKKEEWPSFDSSNRLEYLNALTDFYSTNKASLELVINELKRDLDLEGVSYSISSLTLRDNIKELYSYIVSNTISVNYNRNSCNNVTISSVIIVNKYLCVNSAYNPEGLTVATVDAYNQMSANAYANGIILNISSGFRTYGDQLVTFNYYNSIGETSRAARNGYSEHQLGEAIDITGVNGCAALACFSATPEGQWLYEHAHEYGFIIRYLDGKEAITGYTYEPWHYRYVGVELATSIKLSGLTLEEYFGLI